MSIPDNIKLLVPWRAIELAPSGRSQSLSAELEREICSGHAPHGLKAKAVAVRKDRDDVLFEVEDGAMPLAVVHLSWVESGPRRARSIAVTEGLGRLTGQELFTAEVAEESRRLR